MSKHLFIINDDGNEYQITGARIEVDTFVVDTSLYYETSAEDFYYYVQQLLEAGAIIKYSKELTYASGIINFNSGSIILKAVIEGDAGNGITVTITNPEVASSALAVSVTAHDINISLATDESSTVISTIQEVSDAINTNVSANVLLSTVADSGGSFISNDVSIVSLTGGGTITNLEQDDLMITNIDSLEAYKSRYRTIGKHLLKQYCDFTLQFDFFEFSILNNKLIDAGYIITDINREEKYLEIINTGDSVLISNLETYLEVKDRISIHTHHYNNYITYKDNVNLCSSAIEVDAAYSVYSSLYQ
jgi:hypothetical protein